MVGRGQVHCLRLRALLCENRHAVVEARGSKHEGVRVEGHRRDGSQALVEEAVVLLDPREDFTFGSDYLNEGG